MFFSKICIFLRRIAISSNIPLHDIATLTETQTYPQYEKNINKCIGTFIFLRVRARTGTSYSGLRPASHATEC